ncbi:hypothetical protein QGM71_01365 [Virgibacillus sp. C22-A2]|uniref:Uncharacterized protein n=1 Tax=Virgibacillus tibetensis TaxID=3042313 RepID=A0ABU6KAR8_9BACI|nr:hypothetical protein [Virgibacillus sp. C22-A2]
MIVLGFGIIGTTLVTLAYLETKGKLSINTTVLYIIVGLIAVLVGWWGVEVILETFLLKT